MMSRSAASGRSQGLRGLLALLTGAVVCLALLVAPWQAGASSRVVSVRGVVELMKAKASRNGRGTNGDASGVVIWLEPIAIAGPRPARTRRLMRQQGKRFIPHVLATEVGTEIDFPNEDPFFHNVFSIYDGRRFDLGLYASGETKPVTFNRPGISYIFCNIHPQMSAIVVALETPHYAVTDATGGFMVSGVVEGRYRLEVWHERSTEEFLSSFERELQVGPNDIDLGVLRISEEGFIPRSHRNKHGEEYDARRNRPAYRKP